MNSLFDGLPQTVTVCGEELPIVTDFRTGIIFEELVKDEEMSDEDKIATALVLYYGDDVTFVSLEAINEAIQAILWFYQCGDTNHQKDSEKVDTDRPAFSYDHDAGFIYQAFMNAYNIDLANDYLHWWQFRALFTSLPEDCNFMKIVGYRVMKIPQKASKQQKEYYQKMKKLYALPLPEAQKKQNDELTQALMTGENIQEVLAKQISEG